MSQQTSEKTAKQVLLDVVNGLPDDCQVYGLTPCGRSDIKLHDKKKPGYISITETIHVPDDGRGIPGMMRGRILRLYIPAPGKERS